MLLVEDSPVAMTLLKRMLELSSEIKVVATATNGEEAFKLIPKVNPQIICTDFHMPRMNGLLFTREVMSRFPKPILVISISAHDRFSQNIFDILEAGALDVFPKPRSAVDSNFEPLAHELIKKVKILSGVVPIRKHSKKVSEKVLDNTEKNFLIKDFRKERVDPKIIAIGASTGGPQALHEILAPVPRNFPVPVVCVQHISEGFLQGLVDWLAANCLLEIKIAENGEKPAPGVVYFPPENRHLEIDSSGLFKASTKTGYDGHRPSITITFRSVAAHYSSKSVAILLTGMGKDGAEGMLDIWNAGGITIAQDESSSIIFGMPRQAIELGAARCILSIKEIARVLSSFQFTNCSN